MLIRFGVFAATFFAASVFSLLAREGMAALFAWNNRGLSFLLIPTAVAIASAVKLAPLLVERIRVAEGGARRLLTLQAIAYCSTIAFVIGVYAALSNADWDLYDATFSWQRLALPFSAIALIACAIVAGSVQVLGKVAMVSIPLLCAAPAYSIVADFSARSSSLAFCNSISSTDPAETIVAKAQASGADGAALKWEEFGGWRTLRAFFGGMQPFASHMCVIVLSNGRAKATYKRINV